MKPPARPRHHRISRQDDECHARSRPVPGRYRPDRRPVVWFAAELAAFDAACDRRTPVYWKEDQVEFILRSPHVVGEKDGTPVEVTDYTELRFSVRPTQFDPGAKCDDGIPQEMWRLSQPDGFGNIELENVPVPDPGPREF